MNKYIVTLIGVTSRIEFCFERKLEVYEPDDLSFAKKLISILEFKNRNSSRIATGDYHSESISNIIKITISEEDGEEIHSETLINNEGSLETLSKHYRTRLNEFWDDGGEFLQGISNVNEILDGKYFSRQDRIDVINENLKIH